MRSLLNVLALVALVAGAVAAVNYYLDKESKWVRNFRSRLNFKSEREEDREDEILFSESDSGNEVLEFESADQECDL